MTLETTFTDATQALEEATFRARDEMVDMAVYDINERNLVGVCPRRDLPESVEPLETVHCPKSLTDQGEELKRRLALARQELHNGQADLINQDREVDEAVTARDKQRKQVTKLRERYDAALDALRQHNGDAEDETK